MPKPKKKFGEFNPSFKAKVHNKYDRGALLEKLLAYSKSAEVAEYVIGYLEPHSEKKMTWTVAGREFTLQRWDYWLSPHIKKAVTAGYKFRVWLKNDRLLGIKIGVL